MVKITVKNNLDKPIWYYEWSEFSCADSFSLEKKENEEYKYFSIPGLRKTPTKLVELKPNLEKVYWLNLSKLKERCEGFSPEFLAGIYRLGFHYGFSIEEHWGEKVYSNEFTIKEPKVLLISTSGDERPSTGKIIDLKHGSIKIISLKCSTIGRNEFGLSKYNCSGTAELIKGACVEGDTSFFWSIIPESQGYTISITKCLN